MIASTKRSHEWASSGGGVGSIGGEQIHHQASTSPARTGVAGMLSTQSPVPASPPSSSNASMRKKMVSLPIIIFYSSLFSGFFFC